MKYLSEVTNKAYDSIEECEAAEKEFLEAKAAEEAAARQKLAARKEAAKKVDDAYAAFLEAKELWLNEVSTYCETYGAYRLNLDPKDRNFRWINDLRFYF